jgi:RNA polymerase sigma-70 factor, ECF subfamily
MEATDAVDRRLVRTDGELSFDERFAAARPRLLSLCTSLVGNVEAHDIVQDVYIQAHRRLDQLRNPAALEGWLARIAVNLCYSYHRRQREVVREISPAVSAPAERDVALRELVERLPARERTILVLHYGHGYRLEEIALLLSLSHTNVRTIIARTRRRLLREWREAGA